MIVVMKRGATPEQIEHTIRRVEQLGLKAHPIYGTERTVIAAIGEKRDEFRQSLESGPGVAEVVPILAPDCCQDGDTVRIQALVSVPDGILSVEARIGDLVTVPLYPVPGAAVGGPPNCVPSHLYAAEWTAQGIAGRTFRRQQRALTGPAEDVEQLGEALAPRRGRLTARLVLVRPVRGPTAAPMAWVPTVARGAW